MFTLTDIVAQKDRSLVEHLNRVHFGVKFYQNKKLVRNTVLVNTKRACHFRKIIVGFSDNSVQSCPRRRTFHHRYKVRENDPCTGARRIELLQRTQQSSSTDPGVTGNLHYDSF